MICQSIAQFMVSSGLDPVKFKFAKQSYYTILNKNCPIYTVSWNTVLFLLNNKFPAYLLQL